MNKESWYASKLSDMDVIRIVDSDDFIVEYDKSRGMYRVSVFEDNHFKDECWFDAYEDKEVDDRVDKIIERLECNKKVFVRDFPYQKMTINGFETYIDLLIDWIKDLK